MQETKDEKTFFPYYFFEVAVVALFTVEAVLLLAALFPPAIGREIDFSAQFSPRPEWYFLFMYQALKFFPARIGPVDGEVVGILLFAFAAQEFADDAVLELHPRVPRRAGLNDRAARGATARPPRASRDAARGPTLPASPAPRPEAGPPPSWRKPP